MGLTDFTIELVRPYLGEVKSVCELGAQNVFSSQYEGAPYASEFYKREYTCIDLNGENNAIKMDLAQPIHWKQLPKDIDLVTDFGTSEHIHGGSHTMDWASIYNCWRNKHNLCKLGGLIISENPKTGNWPLHGYNYYTQEFYKQLAILNNYQILSIGEHPAMGNDTNGWNIYCVIRKTEDKPFCKLSEFKTLDLRPS